MQQNRFAANLYRFSANCGIITNMKHHCHCHCGFEEKRKKLRAGKFGVLGGCLVVLHLLYHVAECLVLPAILIAVHRNNAEAADVDHTLLEETTFSDKFFTSSPAQSESIQIDFFDSLEKYALRP